MTLLAPVDQFHLGSLVFLVSAILTYSGLRFRSWWKEHRLVQEAREVQRQAEEAMERYWREQEDKEAS